MQKIEVKEYSQKVQQSDGSIVDGKYTTIDLLKTVLYGVTNLKTNEIMAVHSLMDRFNEFGKKTGKKVTDQFVQLSDSEFGMLQTWVDKHTWIGYAPGVVDLIAAFKKR